MGLIVAIVSAGVAVAAFGYSHFKSRDSAALELRLEQASATQSARIGKIEVIVDMFMKGVSISFAGALHKPDPRHAEMDGLIEKYVSEEIAPRELIRFKALLEKTRDDENEPIADRARAKALLNILKARYDLQLTSPVLAVEHVI